MTYRSLMLAIPGVKMVVGKKVPLSTFWADEKGEATVIEVRANGDYVLEYDVSHTRTIVYNSISVSEK